eukprot:284608-Rhodomonas_salina.1
MHPTRLVVFDFDKTLTVTTIARLDSRKLNDVVDVVCGGALRVRMLHELLTKLRRNGVELAVLTLNKKKIVRKVLSAQNVDLFSFFDVPITPSNGKELSMQARMQVYAGSVHPRDCKIFSAGHELKSRVLKHVLLPYFGISAQNTLFVDDDLGNIRDVTENLPECHTIF